MTIFSSILMDAQVPVKTGLSMVSKPRRRILYNISCVILCYLVLSCIIDIYMCSNNRIYIVLYNCVDMFSANSKLTGKKFTYDGNPHSFGSRHPSYVNYREEDDASGGASQQLREVRLPPTRYIYEIIAYCSNYCLLSLITICLLFVTPIHHDGYLGYHVLCIVCCALCACTKHK
jgi:hypothetical protein